MFCSVSYSAIPPSPPTLREGKAYKKGGETGLKVPFFKGDLGGSKLLLPTVRLFRHPFVITTPI